MPLRAIYRQAIALDEVAVNPTAGVQLPAVRGKRDRIASPAEAARLIDALPQRDRALWATAMYAGLRSGELQALTDELVDLDSNLIRVQWSWDPKEGRVAPKSRAGRRTVPVPAALRRHLLEHRLAHGRRGGLFFGRPDGRPFSNRRPPAGDADLASRRPRADRPARVPAHLRLADDRRGRQRQGALDLHGPHLRDDHARPLRPPVPGLREEAAALLDAYLERSKGVPREGALHVRCTALHK